MWKANFNRAIKEVRFVLKQTPEHHGTWNFVINRLPEITMLNQNTFFSTTEINENFKSNSACHIIYGDTKNTMEEILTSGLTHDQFEKILKEKVAIGLTLTRGIENSTPVSIVEASSTTQYMDDGF